MSYNFTCGKNYTRKQIFEIVGIEKPKGGSWYTGYIKYGEDFFLFCHIDSPGRTGHQYNNHFIGDNLVWFAKKDRTLNQPEVQRLINPEFKKYIFTRSNNKEPFLFLGLGKVKIFEETSPVKIVWEFLDENAVSPLRLAEEITEEQVYIEGSTKEIRVNIYERNPAARQKCIKYYGSICQICEFNFEDVYGVIGEGYIQVHHLKPLSEIGQEYELDPIQDLIPVCANCHAMIHRKKTAYTVRELKFIINNNQ
jgi:5-methylcytosine-specific restriction protein A